MREISDERLDQLLREGIGRLYEVDETEFDGIEPTPIPEELREKILRKAAQVSGMLAAGEAREKGVKINGWESSPGANAEHYYFTPEELTDFIQS